MLIPQATVDIEVDYWNATHKAALLKYPTASQIQANCGTTVQIDVAQLLTYSLFKTKDKAVIGWSSYADLATKLTGFDNNLEGVLEFNGTNICVVAGRTEVPKEYTERVGEAIGLSLINKIHGIHGADWDRIPPFFNRITHKQMPAFDYMLASDEQNLIQVEVKGSALDYQNAQSQASRINSKKQKIRGTAGYPLPTVWLYGTVALIPSHGNGNLKCWLLDPPSQEVQFDPTRVKLINRMRFLSRMISSIGPRTQFASALANRLGDLEQLSDISELDGQPLLTSRGEPVELASDRSETHYPWFATRSTVQGKPVGGAVVETNDGKLFFLGIQQGLLDLAREQKHDAIRAYAYEAFSTKETVNCVISAGRAAKMERLTKREVDGGYVRFEAAGVLWWSEEGLVFGWLETGDI